MARLLSSFLCIGRATLYFKVPVSFDLILRIILLFNMIFSYFMDEIHFKGLSEVRFSWFAINLDYNFCILKYHILYIKSILCNFIFLGF